MDEGPAVCAPRNHGTPSRTGLEPTPRGRWRLIAGRRVWAILRPSKSEERKCSYVDPNHVQMLLQRVPNRTDDPTIGPVRAGLTTDWETER